MLIHTDALAGVGFTLKELLTVCVYIRGTRRNLHRDTSIRLVEINRLDIAREGTFRARRGRRRPGDAT